MYKLILLLVAMCIQLYANEMTCAYDKNKDANSQVESCRLYIAKSICEQNGIAVWSQTKTNNNTLYADEINTKSACSNIGVTVTSVKYTDSTLILTYNGTTEANKVTEVTMEQWNNLKTATTKVQVKQTKMNRTDSTTIVDIAMAIQVDSRKLKTIAKKIDNKANRIIDILFED